MSQKKLANLSIKMKLYLSFGIIIFLLLISIITPFFTSNKYILLGESIFIIIFAVIVAILNVRSITAPIIELASVSKKIAEGNFDVDIDTKRKDEIGQLAVSFKSILSNINAVVSETDRISDVAMKGLLHSRGNTEHYQGSFKDIIGGINSIIESFIGHINALPVSVVISDTDFNIQYTNTRVSRFTGKSAQDLVGDRFKDTYKYTEFNFDNYSCKQALDLKKHVSQIAGLSANGKDYDVLHESMPLLDKNENIVGVLDILQDQSAVVKAQRDAEEQAKAVEAQMQIVEKRSEYHAVQVSKLVDNLDQLANGHLNIQTSIETPDADTEEIAKNYQLINEKLESSTKSIQSYIEEISHVLSEMSQKNLSIQIEREYLGDFESLKESLNNITFAFNTIITDISHVASNVESGADQVTSSSQSLSEGSTEQASAVEQISATVTEITEQTKENALNAQTANEKVVISKEAAQEGTVHMNDMLQAMSDIKESSVSVLNIIKAIDEIAFQTNILALNAAVEAARAGEHGRGFAVVAEEVRSLAARSAEASKETTELINDSISKVEAGSIISNDTAKSLDEIVNGITDAVEVIGGIAESSNQQAIAIEEIRNGIEEISSVTQNISSNAEESASISSEMLQQANSMKTLTSAFITN